MVDRGAAVVPASVGVGTSFEKDLGTLQVPIHDSHIQCGLPLYVHQVHLGPLSDKEVHTVPVTCSGSDSQWRAGEPATAPDRLLVDAATGEHKELVRDAPRKDWLFCPLTIAMCVTQGLPKGTNHSLLDPSSCLL